MIILCYIIEKNSYRKNGNDKINKKTACFTLLCLLLCK